MNTDVMPLALSAVKIHPRNQEFFDDISGEEYEQFKKSIERDGIISEIIVSADMTILSGHQRYKAAIDLGFESIPVRIRHDIVTEEDKLRILLAANFGRAKNDEAKKRKVIAEYVKLCGYGRGGDRKSKDQKERLIQQPTQEDIANFLNISVSTLKRALRIENSLSEPMKELLDTGVISKNVAADIIATLSKEEQEELISSFDTTKRYSQREVEEIVANYKNQITELAAKQPEVEYITSIPIETDARDVSNKLYYLPNTESTLNNIEIFNNPEFGSVRTVVIDNTPWFVGKDVAIALGYANPQEAIRTHVDPEDKGVSAILTPGGRQKVPIINESGLYALIFGSKLKSAKKFKHWVTSEVLPALRKTGTYTVPQSQPVYRLPQNYEEALEDLLYQVKENARLTVENTVMQPKALFYDAVNASEDCVTLEEMAKLLKSKGVPIGRNRLARWLRDEKVLNGRNIPYQTHIEAGLFKIKETVFTDYRRCKTFINTQPLITPKGQDRIIKSFSSYFTQ